MPERRVPFVEWRSTTRDYCLELVREERVVDFRRLSIWFRPDDKFVEADDLVRKDSLVGCCPVPERLPELRSGLSPLRTLGGVLFGDLGGMTLQHLLNMPLVKLW